MIQLQRIRTEEAVVGSLRGRWRNDKNTKLIKLKRELSDIPSKKFKSSWWKKAKPQIKAESNNKCAYCEADTASVAHGDVEHYRPKNKYWWLAYCYDNYLFSCQICNQTYKSNHFPLSGQPLPEPNVSGQLSEDAIKDLAAGLTPDPIDIDSEYTLADFQRDCRREKADLIDPYVDDPEALLEYKALSSPDKEVIVKVKGSSQRRKAMDEALNEFYGLNREELKKLRWKLYRVVQTLIRVLDDGSLSASTQQETKVMLLEMTEANQPFAGMTRFFIKKSGINLV